MPKLSEMLKGKHCPGCSTLKPITEFRLEVTCLTDVSARHSRNVRMGRRRFVVYPGHCSQCLGGKKKRCPSCRKKKPLIMFYYRHVNDHRMVEQGHCQECYDKAFEASRKYNVTVDRALAILEEQAGLCAICGEPGKSLVPDHCHKTGFFRAWLCRHCNLGIGHLRDNPERMRRAAQYVECHQARIERIGSESGAQYSLF